MAAFPYTNFQNPDGSAVSSGVLRIRLNRDGQYFFHFGPITTRQQIISTFSNYNLDVNGNSASIDLSPNANISPSGTYYIYEVLNSAGQLVAGPLKVTL